MRTADLILRAMFALRCVTAPKVPAIAGAAAKKTSACAHLARYHFYHDKLAAKAERNMNSARYLSLDSGVH